MGTPDVSALPLIAAVIYTRISSDREGAGLGVARQEEDCRELALRLGLTIIAVLTDNDISAYSGKPRPGYKKLLAMIKAGEVQVILAWHTDRLHRQPAELEEYITACEERGVTTRTVKAGELDLATPSGRMAARMFGAVARYHVDHMREQMKSAHLQRARSGAWAGGIRPFGFEKDGVTLIPAEAQCILDATKAVLGGVSLKSIAREWNAAEVLPVQGGAWEGHDIRPLLLRARNAGLRIYKGKVIGAALWPAIVPEDLWRACKMRLESASRRSPSGPERRWLGSSLYLCGVCEGVLTRAHGGGQGARVPIYRCGIPGERHVARTAALLDEYVTTVLLEWADSHDLAAPPRDAPPDTASLHDQLAAAAERKREAGRMFQAGTIDGDQLAEITATERQQSALLEARIAAATSISPLTPLEGGADIREVWDALGIARQRAILDYVMTVVVHRSPRGRPAGWRKGDTYFHAESVEFRWKPI